MKKILFAVIAVIAVNLYSADKLSTVVAGGEITANGGIELGTDQSINNSQGDSIFDQVFYVSTAGSDTADGSTGSPLATLAEAVDRVVHSGTIYLVYNQIHAISADLVITGKTIMIVSTNTAGTDPTIDLDENTIRLLTGSNLYLNSVTVDSGTTANTTGMFYSFAGLNSLSIYQCSIEGDGVSKIFRASVSTFVINQFDGSVSGATGTGVTAYEAVSGAMIIYAGTGTWTQYTEPTEKTIL